MQVGCRVDVGSLGLLGHRAGVVLGRALSWGNRVFFGNDGIGKPRMFVDVFLFLGRF